MTKYEKYQLQWMIEHDHSLTELMEELTEYQKKALEFPASPVEDIFFDWERDWGFAGSEIWACEKEWRECEKEREKREKSHTRPGRWIKEDFSVVCCSVCKNPAIFDTEEKFIGKRHIARIAE